jgi:hypothetical protein
MRRALERAQRRSGCILWPCTVGRVGCSWAAPGQAYSIAVAARPVGWPRGCGSRDAGLSATIYVARPGRSLVQCEPCRIAGFGLEASRFKEILFIFLSD